MWIEDAARNEALSIRAYPRAPSGAQYVLSGAAWLMIGKRRYKATPEEVAEYLRHLEHKLQHGPFARP